MLQENKMSDTNKNIELKEDFSGFTEVTVNGEEPTKIDVSEAINEAKTQYNKVDMKEENAKNESDVGGGGEEGEDIEQPRLPGAVQYLRMPRAQQPSFWQSLMGRGLTILALLAIGFIVWWWWSSKSSVQDAVSVAVSDVVNTVQENVVQPVTRVLKLPPQL